MSFLLGGYGTQRTGGGGGLPPLTSIPVGNTLYVDGVFGNNATALPERFDRPYLTIDAAKAAAVQGDLIYIRPALYNVFVNLIKVDPLTNLSMVNYYAEEGVELNCFGVPFESTAATLTGFSNTFSFTGYANVLFCSGNIVLTNAPLFNSTLLLEFDNVRCNNISNGVLLLSGTTFFNVRRDYTCSGRSFSMRLTGNLVCNIGGTVTTLNANIFNGVFWCSLTTWTGRAYIKATTFALGAGVAAATGNWQHIYIDQLIGASLHIELEYLTDTTTNVPAVVQIGNLFAAGDTTQTIVIIDIKRINTNTRALWKVDGSVGTNFANVFVNGDSATSLNVAGASVIAQKGVLHVNYREVVVSSTMSVFGTGTLILSETIVNTQTFAGIVPITIGIGATARISGTTLNTDGVAVPINVATGGTLISQGSRGTIFPLGEYFGNFYVNEVRYENVTIHTVGAAIIVPNNRTLLLVNPAASLLALTITMPPNPLNNQELKISFGGTISLGTVVTSLSIIGNVGQTVLGSSTIPSAVAGDGYILKYEASTAIWRIY